MAIKKTEAIVIKNQDIRETSLLVTFFSKDFGKIQGVVKGIRGHSGKLNNSLEPFVYNEVVFYERKRGNLHTISQCDLKNYFNFLRADIKKTAYAYYFSELIKDFLQLHDKNADVFNLLLNSLISLDEGKIDIEILARIFELKLLSLSGFKPKIDCCLKCSGQVKDQAFFSFREGGLICKKCLVKTNNSATSITQEALFFIHLLEYKKLSELLNLKIAPLIKKELVLIIHQFMRVHIERRFKSLAFIRDIESMRNEPVGVS